MDDLVKAALAWFGTKKPLRWTEEEHIKNPHVNLFTNGEYGIADWCAQHLRVLPSPPASAPQPEDTTSTGDKAEECHQARHWIDRGQPNCRCGELIRAFAEEPAIAPQPEELEPKHLPCGRCGRAHEEYSIDSPVWNAVMRADGIVRDEYICIDCFDDLATEKGIAGWEAEFHWVGRSGMSSARVGGK